MNKVELIGRLVKDVDMKYVSTKTGEKFAVATFVLAVDRRYNANEKGVSADFIRCKAFGRNAEFLTNYFTKGMRLACVGHIQTGSFTNKDGIRVYTTDINVDEVEFCESRKGDGQTLSNEMAAPPEIEEFTNVPDDTELPLFK